MLSCNAGPNCNNIYYHKKDKFVGFKDIHFCKNTNNLSFIYNIFLHSLSNSFFHLTSNIMISLFNF